MEDLLTDRAATEYDALKQNNGAAMRLFALTIMCVLYAGTGCGSQNAKPPAPPTVPASPAPASPAPATETGASAASAAEPAAVAKAPVVPGVSDISMQWPDIKAVKTGWKENGLGLKAHKKKDFETAIKHYLLALKSNPSNIFARYNLACAMALTGKADAAIGLLEQFKAVGCAPCLKRLISAQTDPDFDSIRHLPGFQSAVSGIEIKEPDYRAAATALGESVSKGDFSPIQRSIDAGLFVSFKGVIDDLSGEGNRAADLYEAVSTKDVVRIKQTFTPTREDRENSVMRELRGGEIKGCKDECCEFEVMCGGASDLSSAISEVCFWPASPTSALPIKISYLTCGG